MKKLKSKVTLITGGAQGIGKKICELFISEGSDIALCDVNKDAANKTCTELSRNSVKVKAFYMNVADETSVNEGFKEVINEFGRIDCLVNNAGISRDNLLIRMKKEDWDLVIAVNLTGAFNVSKAVIKHMMKAHYGRIINIASIVGVIGNAGQANYSASKAGIIGLTKSMAKEFASRNITVNAIAPGYIKTEMTAYLSDETKQAFMNSIPLKRVGTPEDIANVALFLASDDASYITGQVICVDGGLVM